MAVLGLTRSTIGTLLPMLPNALHDLNVGFVALAVNVAVMTLVSGVRQRETPAPVS